MAASRLTRLWQPGVGQKRVFLPEFWVAAIESPNYGRNKLPTNCVKFEVDPRMSRHDVSEYLQKIYGLPVRNVRTEVQMGEMTWNTPKDYRYKKAIWKETDKKYAYVFMKKGFEFNWPAMFSDDSETAEVEKYKKQLDRVNQNAVFANSDRKGVAELLS